MSKFHTETVSQQLRVLLIAQPGEITSLLLSSIQDQGLQVLEIQPDQLANSPQLISQLKQEKFYKVIWIYGFSELDYQTAKLVIDFIQTKDQVPIVVSHHLLEPETESHLWQDWQEFALNLKRIQRYLKKNLLVYKEFAGKNVWLVDKVLPPYEDILKGYSQNLFFDPQIELSVQTGQEFVQLISKELFRPNKNKYLIKGKRIDSTIFLKDLSNIVKKYYQKQIQVKSFSVDLKQTQVLYESFIKAQAEVDYDKLLELIARKLPDLNLDISSSARKELHSSWLKTEVVKEVSLEKKDQSVYTPPLIEPKKQKKEQDLVGFYEQEIEKKVFQKTKKTNNNLTKKISKKISFEEDPIIDQAKETKKIKNQSKGDKQVDEELHKLFADKRVKQKVKRRREKAGIINKIKNKSRHKKVVFVVGILLFIIGLGMGVNFLIFVFNFKTSRSSLITLIKARQKNKIESEISSSLPFKIKTLQKQTEFLDKIIDLTVIDKSHSLVDIYQEVRKYLSVETEYYQSKARLVSMIWGTGLQDPQQVLQKFNESVAKTYEHTSMIQAELKNINMSLFEPEEQKVLEEFEQYLDEQRKSLAKEQQLAGVMDKLLGLERQVAVWLVLQDNQELRPTGGFIQGFAKLTLNNGSLIDQQVFNVNQIDKNLMGNIDAPAEVKALLGEERLYLRDSNWDPDFPATAEQISWFIKESLNQPVDVVIGINYELIQDVLGIVGDIHLSKYDETINQKNLYERLKYHASEEKEEQLAENYHYTVLKTVLNQLIVSTDKQKLDVMEALKNSLEEKQTVISAGENVNPVLQTLSWTGAIIEPTCPSQFAADGDCRPDTLFQVETNIGINKVNPYITRTLDHQIKVEPGKVSHVRTTTMKNQAFSQAWPLGSYKAYYRFYLTNNSVLNYVKINDEKVTDDQLIQYQSHQRKVIGVVVEVPIQEETNLTLAYEAPFNIGDQAAYLFFDQQQPGVSFEYRQTNLTYSSALVPVLIAPKAEIDQQTIRFDSTERDHSYMGVLFEKPFN